MQHPVCKSVFQKGATDRLGLAGSPVRPAAATCNIAHTILLHPSLITVFGWDRSSAFSQDQSSMRFRLRDMATKDFLGGHFEIQYGDRLPWVPSVIWIYISSSTCVLIVHAFICIAQFLYLVALKSCTK